jgi:L-ascorbate metabolism protein UlaG (beta-lactamase superfamily)
VRITKYPQSCLLVETGAARLLIDPGTFVTAVYDAAEFGEVDAVLYTHRHADHFDASLLDPLAEAGARFVGNADVASLIERHEVTVLDDRDTTTIAGVSVQAFDIPHCVMVDGSPGPPNLGFVVEGALLHPGDGLDAPAEVEIVAAPIAGPSVSMHDAYRLVAAAGASQVIPIHYDAFIAKPEQFAEKCAIGTVHVLADGASVDLPTGESR